MNILSSKICLWQPLKTTTRWRQISKRATSVSRMWIKAQQFSQKMETQLKSGIALINFHHAENVNLPLLKVLTQSQIHTCHTQAASVHSPQMTQSLLTGLSHFGNLMASQSHLQKNIETRTHMHALLQHTKTTITFERHKKIFNEAHKTWICTCLQNLLKHPEWSRLSRWLVRLLVLLQHLVDFGICCNVRPLRCRRGLRWSSAKQN